MDAVGDVVAVELVMVEAAVLVAGVDRAVPGERFSEQESLKKRTTIKEMDEGTYPQPRRLSPTAWVARWTP